MADDAQDLEIENILSSIKGILEEDEGNSKNEPLSPSIENESNVVDDVLSQDMDDDVLELSQDMRIEHQEGDPEQAVEEIIVPDITPQDDITTESVTEEDAEPVVEEISEPEVTTPQEEMVAEPVVEETTEPVVEEIPEPEVTTPQEEMVAESVVEETTEQVVEEIPEPEVTIPQEEMVAESVVEETTEPVVEEIPEPEVTIPQEEMVAESVVEEIPEPEVTTPQEEMVAEPVIEETTEQVVEEVVETDGAVDASANIISNFAKMFSKNKDEQSEPKQQVTGLGNANHTLEDFVKEAIIKVIGDDIARQWNDGADYRTMAEAEIKKQVQVWVNDNMPKMVEKIVKDEMERVIAKVGS